MLGLIKRNFKDVTIPILLFCYVEVWLGHILDHCCSVWTPYRKGDTEALEKVQKKSN